MTKVTAEYPFQLPAPGPRALSPSGRKWTAHSQLTSPLRGSRTKIDISATRRVPELSRATWMTASSTEASCACSAVRGSLPSEANASNWHATLTIDLAQADENPSRGHHQM
ncbi:MAG TPA: hypothetical protein VNT27_00295, partial [Propionibacteriaceae bacterium]|nr:hypothetical protein [Propionibacteriaceae bacterium]